MPLKIAFALFAILSFVRSAILILNLFAVAPWTWLTQMHLMISPQTIVFADPLFYEQIDIFQLYESASASYTTRYDYIASTPGPYILDGAVFNHALIFYQSFRGGELGALGAYHLRHRFCAPSVTGILIAPRTTAFPKPYEGPSLLSCGGGK